MSWSNKWGDDKGHTILNYKIDSSVIWEKKKQLTLTNGKKQYTFTAEIVGDLALDFTPEGQPNAGWNIYHVPTLTCFSKAVPGFIIVDDKLFTQSDKGTVSSVEWGYSYSREALLTWMAKVQKNYPTSWTMLRLLTPANYSDSGQSAKDIILKWCLSVPVVEE